MTGVAPWEKRLREPTLRAISQNQSLGARYFRLEALSSSYGRPANNPIHQPSPSLEELANHRSLSSSSFPMNHGSGSTRSKRRRGSCAWSGHELAY